MTKRFTFERPPFTRCPAPECQRDTFGILSVGGDHVTLRCTECRYSHSETLPQVDKRAIYLDQSIFSQLFQLESGGRLLPGHEEFVRELFRLIRRVVLLQQVVLPHSDVHHDETIVFHSANKLQMAYERFGGDARLADTRDVDLMQMREYVQAYIEQREPVLSFDVDEVLETKRNRWLPDMHIHVNANYEMFADSTRKDRDRSHEGMQRLVEKWAAEQPTFEQLLDRELRSFFTRPQALLVAIENVQRAATSDDPMAFFEASHHHLIDEFRMLSAAFVRAGVVEADVGREVLRFWNWDRNLEQPHHRISSYMFAAIGRRVASGQRRVNRGMMNDVRAIATYAPYVDAMFVDKECAALLAEPRLAQDLNYKARIFSLTSGQAFLDYLTEIDAATPPEVCEQATRIYGIKTDA
jgi:hypothetical protein